MNYTMTKEQWAKVPSGYKSSTGRGKANVKKCFAAFVPGCEGDVGTALVTVEVTK